MVHDEILEELIISIKRAEQAVETDITVLMTVSLYQRICAGLGTHWMLFTAEESTILGHPIRQIYGQGFEWYIAVEHRKVPSPEAVYEVPIDAPALEDV